MPGQPIERFRFLDGFMNQSPRIIASIREKGYRFFPSLEAEAETLRRRFASDRETLKSEATAGTLSERSVTVMKELEAETAPLLRKLDRIRKLLGGISTNALTVAPPELPVWQEDSFVVAKGNRIPVAVYLTTERLVLVRVEAAAGAKNSRDYKLSALTGIAPLSADRPDGAVLVFGNDKLALATYTTDYWKKLVARIRSSEFQRDLAPEPLHVESEGESARTTILTPEVIAKAMAESRGKAAATDERLETPLETLLTEQIPEPAIAPAVAAPVKPSLPDFEIIEPTPAPVPRSAVVEDAPTLMVPTLKPEVRREEPKRPPAPSQELEEVKALAIQPEPAVVVPPKATDRGPGGHDVLSFDAIFEEKGRAADATPLPRPPAPEPPKAPPRPPAPPASSAPAESKPASPSKPVAPPAKPAPKPADGPKPPAPTAATAKKPEAETQGPAKGLLAQDAVRSKMRAEGSRYATTKPTTRPKELAAEPEAAAGKKLPGAMLIGGAIVILVLIVLVVAFVIKSRGSRSEDLPEVPAVHGGSKAKTPKAEAPNTETPAAGATEAATAPPATDGSLPAPKPIITHVIEETMVTTPIGTRPLIQGPLPPPDPVEKGSKIPAYDASNPKYRVVLKNKKDWVVTSYQRNKDRVYVKMGEGHVEVPLSEIVRIEPAK